jgi:dTDP-4-dehydrorhamnose reductase
MAQRILIVGASGLLGRALLRHRPEGVEPLAPGPEEQPMEDLDRLRERLRVERVDRVLWLAAWTAVDDCEADPDRAFLQNGILPGRAAQEAARLGLPLVFLGTDYVFDGRAQRPYREFDTVGPLSVYARSKWYGECRVREAGGLHRIVRAAGLYGPGGPDFVGAMLERLRRGPVRVVTDEVNTPTLVDDLAPALWRVALGEEPGTWHLTARGAVSRYDFARRIAELAGLDADLVQPTTHAELGRPAPRPAYSVLDCQAAQAVFGCALPSWEDGIARHLGGGGGRA